MKINDKHKKDIEKYDDYIYIGTYEVNEEMLNGKLRKPSKSIVKIKHKYCNKINDIRLDAWKDGARPKCCCYKYENSFAYYIIEELNIDIDKMWNWDKNGKLGLNPYHLYKQSTKKVWIYCLKHNHHNDYGGYLIDCHHFYSGNRCSYCSSGKVHKNDSFAQWGVYKFGKDFLEKYWSSKNTLNPWGVSKQKNEYIYMICQYCKKEYKVKVGNFYNGCRCNICNKSHGEVEIYSFLYNKNILFDAQKPFDGLVGVGGKGLTYDFYLPTYNVLIEYQGAYHDGNAKHQTEAEFKYRGEHDRRKRMFAVKNNINLLEIWYWDFNLIDKILENLINKEKENTRIENDK